LDINPKCGASVTADIREWNPTDTLSPGEVHFMWSSPPCPEYSPAKTTAPRDLPSSDEIVKAAIRVTMAIKPTAWVIENPTGLLRERPFMRPLLKFLKPTSYCRFAFKYRKETDIFTNIPCHLPHCRLERCKAKHDTGVHEETAQRGSSRNGTRGNSREDLHRVPFGLVQTLFRHAFEEGQNEPAEYLPEVMSDWDAREFYTYFV
jgi:hypothetical protein